MNQLIRARWITVVGILGLVSGSCGTLEGGQIALMPKMLEMQKAMLSSFPEPTDAEAAQQFERSSESLKQLQEQLMPSGRILDWSPALGVVTALTSIAVFFGSLLLLILNPLGARILQVALPIAIVWKVARLAIMAGGSWLMLMGMAPCSLLMGAIEAALLVTLSGKMKQQEPGPAGGGT